MKNAVEKTNAIRILTQKKAVFQVHSYEPCEALNGVEVAAVLGQVSSKVYKTLVTTGKTGEHYVFIIPVDKELDLKKAAEAAGEKNISMLKSKDLLSLTGYVHGGCSPVGMKKLFTTFLDESAQERPSIIVSGGRIGTHIELAPSELLKAIPFRFANLTGGEAAR